MKIQKNLRVNFNSELIGGKMTVKRTLKYTFRGI